VFVVAGPLTDDSLLRLVGQLGASISGLESCTSPDRWRPLSAAGAPADSEAAAVQQELGAKSAFSEVTQYLALAREILALGVCPRRSTAERRDYLARRLDESRPSSIIYARQSFCDPGAYDAVLVAQLAEERGLPFLEMEVGFPFEASGPLRTRVEAFLEAQMLDEDLLDDDLLGELLDTDDLEPGGFAAGLEGEE
jgi:benzoyl-CoA reductase/2-hydroxyglutaryl-CoA dehydratase subunit BcrC/BadD/HgdB